MPATQSTTDDRTPAHNADRSLTRPQVARLLGVGVATVQAWIDKGELAARNVAADTLRPPRWVVMPDDLQDFLDRRSAPGREPLPKRRKRKEDDAGAEYFRW